MCFQPLKNCTESEQRCKWLALQVVRPAPPLLDGKIMRAQANPRFGFPRLPAFFPLPLSVWHCEIKCFFFPKWTWKSYEFSNTLLRRRRGENFHRGSCPVMFPHKKWHASLSVPTKNWKTVLRRRRGKKLLSNHFRNRGRPPQRGSARQFFGNHLSTKEIKCRKKSNLGVGPHNAGAQSPIFWQSSVHKRN